MSELNVKPLISWIIERDRIRERRAAGEPPPWSADELFATYRFCNVNVSDDRVSRAIFETFTRPYADHPSLIVALTVCRFTNAPEVSEVVRDCLVPFDPERFVAIMADRDARGLPKERRAYMIPGGEKGKLKAASLTRDLFIPLANAVEQIRPKPGDTCSAVFERLRHFPHLGKGFITAQIIRDLKQAGPLRAALDWQEFVWPGPGSQRGINRLLGATTEADIERERPVPEWTKIFWEAVNLAAPRVAEEGVEIDDAQSWQNCLCECDKMLRFRSGKLNGARSYSPQGEAPARRTRKVKPVLAPTPIEILPPVAHAIPELAAVRDPNAQHALFHDIETRSTADLKVVGTHKYAADPTTEVLCIAYAVDGEPVQLWTPGDPVPAEFVEAGREQSNWTIVSHNDQFERLISHHVLEPRFGFPAIPIERRRCSMAMANAAALPGALDKAVEALSLPHAKDKVGQAHMRRMARPLPGGAWIEDAASREQLYAYCRRDVEAERALYRALPPLSADEQRLWSLDATINARGFHTDGALLDAAHRLVTTAEDALQSEFREITGLKSTDQTAKLITWLGEHDCAVGDVQKATLAQALRRKGLTPEVRRAIEIRRELAHASANKIEALLAWRGDDGRVRGTLKYGGAATGRWTGHGPQPQNFKRDGEHIAAKIAAVMNGGDGLESPVEAVGSIARAMITAAPGHKLLIADLSGIESRVLACISGQQSKVNAWARFDLTGAPEDDPYVRIAQRCGLSGEDTRDKGKRIDLAFGFGGSVGAYQRSAPEDDTTDEATIKRYRDTWRAEHPETVKFWYALDRAAIAAVGRPGTVFPVGRVSYCFEAPFLRLMLPSGRAISYPFARIAGTDKFGRPQLSFLDNAGGKFVDCRFGQGCWFGMLVENVVQGVARDLLASALMRLEGAGYPVVLHVHDEVVCEVPDGFGSTEEFRQIITTPPDWAAGLPVAAKARNGLWFAKLSARAETTTAAEPPQPQVGVLGVAEIPGKANERASGLPRGSPFGCNPAAGSLLRFSATSPVVTMVMTNGGGRGGGGTTWADNNSADRDYTSGNRKAGGTFETAYVYPNANGSPHSRTLVFRLPYGDKRCAQQFYVNGQWLNEKPEGWVPLPFNLPAVIKAERNVPIWACEGEPDAIAVGKLGFVTTTNSEGAGHFTADHAKWLTGKQTVYVVQDSDDAGRAHASKVAELSHGVGVQDIRIISFPELEGLPPWPNGKKKKDVSDWLKLGHTKEELIERAQEAPKFERPLLPFMNMSQWDGEPIPDQEWTVPYKIPMQECAIFSGEGGAGKSMEGLHLCAAHTIGRECWHTIPKQGPAIFIDAEDNETVIHRRLAAVREHYGVTFADLIKGGLHLISLVGHDPVLATVNRSGKIEPTALYKQLLEAAGDIKPIQMVIASSANVFAGNENDRSQAQQFVGLLARLALVAKGSTVLISHPSLTGISTGSGLSGSTAWHNAVRARFVMRGIKSEEGEQLDDDLREIEFKKSQHSALSESIVVRFQNGMFLPVNDASLDQAAREAQAEEIFLDLLRRFTRENRFVSGKPSSNYAPALFAKEDEAKREGLTSKAFEGAMRRLFKAGTIWNEPCGKPSRPSYRIALKTGA